MIAVGFDPGLRGAVAFVDSRGTFAVEDIPTIELAGKGLVTRRVDGRALIMVLRQFCRPGEPVITVCEAVRAMGGKNNAIQIQGSLTRTLGAIEAVLDIMRIPPQLVEPQTWKRFYGLTKDKKRCLELAREMFPTAPLGLVKHHNRAESLLIAHYGLRHFS